MVEGIDTKSPISSEDNIYINKKEIMAVDKDQRELRRIKKSFSYRLANILVYSIKKPWKLLTLPYNILFLIWQTFMIKSEKNNFINEKPIIQPVSDNDCILLFPTNGVGFGHFNRLFAIAKKIRNLSPNTEIIFFTTMPTLHLLENYGFPCYHMPGSYKFKDMGTKKWNLMCEETMSNIIQMHNPHTFIFDGSYPYRGMLDAIKNRDNISKLWLLKGNFKPNSKPLPEDSFEHFDRIIYPNGSLEDTIMNLSNVPYTTCNPILLLDNDELLSKEALRNRLGIPLDAIVAYVQLGAGKINDIESIVTMVIESLLEHKEIFVVVGESMLGGTISSTSERVRIIREYPNSKYFKSFDFAFLAGGYNSYHEAISFALPTICLPNLKTGKDNQFSRAKFAKDKGCMFLIKDINKNTLSNSIIKILDPEIRKEMRFNCEKLRQDNGADDLAQKIVNNNFT